jgi:hypothetical protein
MLNFRKYFSTTISASNPDTFKLTLDRARKLHDLLTQDPEKYKSLN